jgi:hypothetical protein
LREEREECAKLCIKNQNFHRDAIQRLEKEQKEVLNGLKGLEEDEQFLERLANFCLEIFYRKNNRKYVKSLALVI